MLREGAHDTSRLSAVAVLLALRRVPCHRRAASRTRRRQPDVVFVPTPPEVVDAMLKLAKVTASDVVYDLGSGDGRIPIAAAKTYGAHGVGIDIDPERIREATANARDGRRGRQGDVPAARISSPRTSARRPWSRCTCRPPLTHGSSRS